MRLFLLVCFVLKPEHRIFVCSYSTEALLEGGWGELEFTEKSLEWEELGDTWKSSGPETCNQLSPPKAAIFPDRHTPLPEATAWEKENKLT